MKTSRLILTLVNHDQLEVLQQLSITTFRETFGAANKKENLEAYLKKNMNRKQFIKELNNPDSFFYFAYYQQQLVGYLKLNFNQAQTEDILDNKAFEIERIYLLQKYQNQGLGTELLEAAIEFGKEQNYRQLWLGVWESNFKALTFYRKRGFIVFDSHHFQLGEDLQTDLLMQIDISD